MFGSTTTQCLFPDLFGKRLVACFDVDHGSSDGGAVLLKAADRRLGLIDGLSDCVVDRRDQRKVVHDVSELLGQRIFALACGYADCNDAARLAADEEQAEHAEDGRPRRDGASLHDAMIVQCGG